MLEMIKYLALELRRSFRDRRYLLLVAGWPVAAYLLFSTVFGAAADRTEGLSPTVEIMVAMASFGAMGGVLLASGPRLAMDRQTGWLRQLRLTPLSPARILTARLISAMALSLPAIVLTFIAAVLVKGVTLPLWEWPLLVLVIAAGCLPFAALGILVGTIADGDGAQGLTMALYLVLAALGGLWMPVQILPSALQTVAKTLPSYHLAQLGWHIAQGVTPAFGDALVLLAWFAGAALLAVAASRRLTLRTA
jgi:ABC-2 type transport system permease protein